jgi:DNA-binding Lrp family transcriptional regulator
MESKLNTLDYLDFQILDHLTTNARVTWTELSTKLNLSAPAITERVRKLEERGIIRGYTVLLEPELLGCELLAGLMGRSTKELAARSGSAFGGLLNATFGNATELIIAFFFLPIATHS